MNIMKVLGIMTVIGFLMTAPIAVAKDAPLNVEVFRPGADSIFQPNSVLISGKNDMMVIDAQFSVSDAQKLVDMVKKSGKNLKIIYISIGDPDFYFGLDVLAKAFPKAEIVATQPVIDRIKKTYVNKMEVWGPKLGAEAPKQIIIPALLNGRIIELEGHKLEIMGLEGPMPEKTFVWIPSIKTVAGGGLLFGGAHMFLADTKAGQQRRDWISKIETIKALKPDTVIPALSGPGTKYTVEETADFTIGYIRAFEEETVKAKNSEELISAMKKRYPAVVSGMEALIISSKVAKNEIEWD